MQSLTRGATGFDDVSCLAEQALYNDDGATLEDLREAVATLADAERISRRVFGGQHPHTTGIEVSLRYARAALRARDGGVSAIRDAVEAMTSGGA